MPSSAITGVAGVRTVNASPDVAIAVPAMTTAVMQVAGRQHGNSAAAALNANRQIGALVGVAVMGAILHTFAGWNMRTSLAFGFICAMYAVALLLVSRYIASTPRDTRRPSWPPTSTAFPLAPTTAPPSAWSSR